MKKIRAWISKNTQRFSEFIQKTFSSRKRTFQLLALIVFTTLFLLQMASILINNSFYNNSSDDVLQYYTIIVDFINSLKDGSISWFNLNNYFGASFFSDVYYIPIDIFTGTTFLLSYLMPTGLAYSVTELFKIFLGVMLFAYYLKLNNMKNRTIFWMGLIYFISGGTVSFMAFPVFCSLTVYMPLALIVIHFFFKKKRWLVPLFAFASIFYDFYLGYTILAFSCFAFILEYIKRPNFKFFPFVKEIIIFVFLLLLGVLMSAVIAYPSILFIMEETYRTTGTFNSWTLFTIGDFEFNLFQPNIYIRYLAKMFVEQKPIGFYGFENSYATEHFSLYISVIGFVYMNYIFFMRDRISKIYKVAIFVALIFMIIPLFSYVFSGSLDAPYTRWVNMLPIFQVMILAHVFDKHGFEEIKMKYATIIISLFILIIGGLVYYYITQLNIDQHLASRDILVADTVLLCVAALYLVLFLIFGWLKKWKVIKVVLWVEMIVAVGYIYSGPLSIRNKIDTFDNAYQIDLFLEENLEKDEFYRVYVDIDLLNVEDTNFNRMTSFATNTGIFHSWTDYETNAISKLLFNKDERQSKNAMNTFGYYMNHFLGYKYIIVSVESNYGFSDEHFSLVAENTEYSLYEMKFETSFKVYESYMSYDEFSSFRSANSDLATQRVLLFNAILQTETQDETQIDSTLITNIEHLIPEDSGSKQTVYASKNLFGGELVSTQGVSEQGIKEYYVYTNEDLQIDFTAGAIYVKSQTLEVDDYGEIFMSFPDGSRKLCIITDEEEHQFKCEFSVMPEAIYVEKTTKMTSAPVFKLRLEAAIDRAAYLVYDLSKLDFEESVDFLKFKFMTSSYELEKSFVIDDLGEKHYLLDGFLSLDYVPSTLFVYKTSKLYESTALFSVNLVCSYDVLSDVEGLLTNNFVSNESISIKNGRIDLYYENLSDSNYDQIIMIPVCYSDDWKFVGDEEYETLSVSGGFLGIIIPNGTDVIDVSLKFVPKGLSLGGLASLGGILIYSAIFVPYFIKNKRKNGDDEL